jgi:hypothetical protein
VTDADVRIRKLWTQAEEIRTAAGRGDDGGPLRKVAACAVVTNPFAGRGRLNARLGRKSVADVTGGPRRAGGDPS